MNERQLDDLDHFGESDQYSELERQVLRFAEEVTRTGRASEETLAPLAEVLSERDVVELTLTVALANLTNRFNEALGTELEGG